MTSIQDIQYFEDLRASHTRRHFAPAVAHWMESQPIRYVPRELLRADYPGVQVITDVPLSHDLSDVRYVPFNGTSLTIWETMPTPGPEWLGWPSDAQPLLHVSASGAIVPAWNLLALSTHLLDLAEENQNQREKTGRTLAVSSPRHAAGLLTVPAVNEAFAVLAVAVGMASSSGRSPDEAMAQFAPRATLCLSHDLDQLRGNDRWTQAVRAFRPVTAVRQGELPDPRTPWLLARNWIRPWSFYSGNVRGMLELEAMAGFGSTLYFLNGTRGRHGARSGDMAITRLLAELSRGGFDDVDFGIHYNYDTLDDLTMLMRQVDVLAGLIGERPMVGRAHYLRYTGPLSLATWRDAGIVVDESLGYPDDVGYRAGYGGVFLPRGCNHAPLEVPLVVMDGALIASSEFAPAEKRFAELVEHMSCIGGVVSLLFHPGVFDNPEFPVARSLYRRLLEIARTRNLRSETAVDVARSYAC